jgi:hypothetical protein
MLSTSGVRFEIADRMGVLRVIRSKRDMLREVAVVNRDGRRVAEVPTESYSRTTHGRCVSLPRGVLAASVFCSIEEKFETMFGDSVDPIEQTGRRRFRCICERRFAEI